MGGHARQKQTYGGLKPRDGRSPDTSEPVGSIGCPSSPWWRCQIGTAIQLAKTPASLRLKCCASNPKTSASEAFHLQAIHFKGFGCSSYRYQTTNAPANADAALQAKFGSPHSQAINAKVPSTSESTYAATTVNVFSTPS